MPGNDEKKAFSFRTHLASIFAGFSSPDFALDKIYLN